MIIAVDVSPLAKSQQTGVEHYTRYLLENLAQIDRENIYWLYSPQTLPKYSWPNNFIPKIIPWSRGWTQVRLAWELWRKKPDIFFSPGYILPFFAPKNSAITIHDLTLFHFPAYYPFKERTYGVSTLKRSTAMARKIIVPSEFTKQDLIKTLRIDPPKITVIPLGFDEKLFYPAGQKREKPYIFYLGRLEERKNLISLIDAFELLCRNPKFHHRLILTGKKGYGAEKITEHLEKLSDQIRKRIELTGYLSDREVVKLMRGTEIFVLPSLYEGFGLPIIQAMASGVAVACSHTGSLPEVAGNAALLFNPRVPLEIAGSISKILTSPALKKSLIQKGLQRSKEFSWQKTAHSTLALFRSLA